MIVYILIQQIQVWEPIQTIWYKSRVLLPRNHHLIGHHRVWIEHVVFPKLCLLLSMCLQKWQIKKCQKLSYFSRWQKLCAWVIVIASFACACILSYTSFKKVYIMQMFYVTIRITKNNYTITYNKARDKM